MWNILKKKCLSEIQLEGGILYFIWPTLLVRRRMFDQSWTDKNQPGALQKKKYLKKYVGVGRLVIGHMLAMAGGHLCSQVGTAVCRADLFHCNGWIQLFLKLALWLVKSGC